MALQNTAPWGRQDSTAQRNAWGQEGFGCIPLSTYLQSQDQNIKRLPTMPKSMLKK